MMAWGQKDPSFRSLDDPANFKIAKKWPIIDYLALKLISRIAMKQLIDRLEHILSNLIGAAVRIRINCNKRSLIRLINRSASAIYLSVHHLFLNAPLEIVNALALFIKGDQRARLVLAHFIHTYEERTGLISPSKLITEGKYHALDVHYQRVHRRYFPHTPPISVTWYALPHPKARCSLVLGLFDRWKKVIKVHRFLDRAEVPSLFVEFVLYHEALHNFFLPLIDENRGKLCLHSSEFKKAERSFEGYRECRLWQREHLFKLLRQVRA